MTSNIVGSHPNRSWARRRVTVCTLGVDFYDGDPAHHGISAAQWNNRPPGVPRRATTLEGWRTDKDLLDNFIDVLSTGGVAVPPPGDDRPEQGVAR